MNVLMYPIAPEDDFPDEFCAIRQGSGEHWFYTPAGEDASWMLFRAESENAKMRHDLEEANNQAEEVCIENAKLRELVHILCHCMNLHAKCNDCRLNGSKGELAHDKLCACGGLYKMLRELGIEAVEC